MRKLEDIAVVKESEWDSRLVAKKLVRKEAVTDATRDFLRYEGHTNGEIDAGMIEWISINNCENERFFIYFDPAKKSPVDGLYVVSSHAFSVGAVAYFLKKHSDVAKRLALHYERSGLGEFEVLDSQVE